MKIKFNGIYQRGGKGCPVCGKRINDVNFLTIKTYILPSGRTKTFRAGRVEEVSEKDADFLLSYRFTDKEGNVQPAFEVING